MIGVDAKARRVIMASVLYYGCDFSAVNDEEFDQLCEDVANDWSDLHPFRRWQLGSTDEIRASGFGIRATQYSVAGALRWYDSVCRHRIKIVPTEEWRYCEEHLVHWLRVTEFRNDGIHIPGVDRPEPEPEPEVHGLGDYF
jgi:hypothetical protein